MARSLPLCTSMTTIVGLFGSSERALEALEALRGARLNTDRVRIVGGPEHITELANSAGAGTRLAAGPADAVIEGLIEPDLSASELESVRKRVQDGGALVLGEDLDQDAANALAQHLREHQAENVIVEGPPANTDS